MSKGRIGIIMMVVAALAVAAGVFYIAGGAKTPAGALLAQVGVAVGVAPNPYNTLNEQLNAKQVQLEEEAADLAAQKAALASSTAAAASFSGAATPAYWYLVAAVGVLVFLIGLNLYVDWRRMELERARERQQPRTA